MVVSALVTKKEITTSSKLIAAESIMPESTAGKTSGRVISFSTRIGFAPKSRAASDSAGSMPIRRDLTLMNTYGMQKVVCVRISAPMPSLKPTAVNTERYAMPSTSSGIIIGSVARVSTAPPSFRWDRASPMAPSVPTPPASRAETTARISEFLSASAIRALENRRLYQLVVKPCQLPMVRPLLKE